MSAETYAIMFEAFLVLSICGVITGVIFAILKIIGGNSKPTQQWILEDELSHTKVEDGGLARYAEIKEPDNDMFIRIHSWDVTKRHTNYKQMEGRRVRITVEVVE